MKALHVAPLPIDKIFSDHEFIIPDFQRPYSWEVEQCEQLWVDISDFLDEQIDGDGKEQYFLGSIVVYPDEHEKWVIVDGQQRLTTLLILIRLLFDLVGTYIVLQKMFYKIDPITTDIIHVPRLESRVMVGGGRNDYKEFKKVMNQKTDDLSNDNPYKLCHDVLKEKLHEWWGDKDTEQRKRALTLFQKNIVLLPILCDSLDDALTLFQIINDRGMNLTDADIFKSKIYGMSNDPSSRESFIKRWSNLDDHETLFRIHMHTLRAKAGDTKKETGLRPYIQNYFAKLGDLENNWNLIVRDLENYHSIRVYGAIEQGEPAAWEEKIYWAILNHYPNIYWWYPLYVFLNKYGCHENGRLVLENDKHEQYVELLKNTIQYFYIKGIVYNTVNRIRDTTFKVCVAIEREENYLKKYQENTADDHIVFKKKLEANDYSFRYLKGLVWLCSSLNDKQDRKDYAETIENCHLEHIVPRSWASYDRWNEKTHEEKIETIGNKIPLEWKLNIQASDQFFQRKQERYMESKIQDALDLSKKSGSQWYPNDVDERQIDSLNRLKTFFGTM